jgi:hypothetical protein
MSRSKKTWNHLVDYYGNYAIDIKNGLWPGSGLASKGSKGEPGPDGKKGERGLRGLQGKKGEVGPEGIKGSTGSDGDTAYEIAVNNGFVGTEADFIESLKGNVGATGLDGQKGEEGLNAYQTAVKGGHFKGTEAEWVESLKGSQGIKGEQGGIFTYRGKEDTLQDIESLPGPHEPGDVYQDDSTDDLYVWDGSQFVLLSEQLDVVKGQKGDEGQKGDTGTSAYEEAVTGGFTGTEAEWIASLKGDKGDDGLTAYEIAFKGGFLGTETEWLESLKGNDGEKGQKGVKGDKGEEGEKGVEGDSTYDIYAKGTTDNPVLDEIAWLDSLKGDKGEEADPHELDNYYDKGQVNQLLDALPEPKDAYSINFMGDKAVIGAGETVDFLDQDVNAPIYERGIITVLSGAGANNSPLLPPFVVTNRVLVDDTIPRGVDYTITQEVRSVQALGNQAYFRSCRPGADEFGEWTDSSFDITNYYNKGEVDTLVGGITYTLGHKGATVSLTDKDGGTTNVPFIGKNGIGVTSTAQGIEIDSGVLTGPQFLGVLQSGQDPASEHTSLSIGVPVAGQYFIYGYDGVTVNTDPDAAVCTSGDWCIYSANAGAWTLLDISADTGVMSVRVGGGLLTVDNTDPASPVVELDSAAVVTPSQLAEYPTKDQVAASLIAQNVEDLANVDVTFTRLNPGGVPSAYISHNVQVDVAPSNDGEYFVDVDANEIHYYYKGSNGTLMDDSVYNWIDVNDTTTLVRLQEGNYKFATVARPIAKRKENAVRILTFDSPNPTLFALEALGSLDLDIVENGAGDGDVLAYDTNTSTWKTSSANFVKKVGGDSMQGPLTMQAVDPTDGRATNKIHTLGIFSNSDSSALRLGTTKDRVYIGHNDVSIAGPLKVGEIQEKDDDAGITVSSQLIVDVADAVAGEEVFSIVGTQSTGNTGTKSLSLVKENDGDQLRYYGPIKFEKEVTTKEHVDNLIDFTNYSELT